MNEGRTVRRPFEKCGGIGCWALYDKETGELIRVTDCMAANYLNNPLVPDEVEQGKRLQKTCPISGKLEGA